ncbi:MAG: inositol monophosphatase family protein [bacterium]
MEDQKIGPILEQAQDIITMAIKKLGATLVDNYNNFDRKEIEMKSPHEIVTKYDRLSEKIILEAIHNNFPDHAVLSEEQGRDKTESEWLWLVDPIDGTTNFSMHNPLWSVSICLLHNDEPVLGVIYAPALDELFIAKKGQGAFLNNKPLKVSEVDSGKVINTFCHGSSTEAIKRAVNYYSIQKLNRFDCRQLGSAAIEMAYVAAGRIESITIPDVKIWDVAAGSLLVREAGGKVTDFTGNEWELASPDIIASNGLVHEQILTVVKDI